MAAVTLDAPRPAGPPAAEPPRAGQLLRAWRLRRRLSQLDLACLADVSTRHLSYVETGRSRPSRAFLLHVAEHLDVPLRSRNELLLAAGYAPVYGERDLEEPQMAAVRQALDLVLGHQEPFPALVEGLNVLRLSLHPDGLAGRIEDFSTFSGHVLARIRRQVALTGDQALAALYDELCSFPGVTRSEPWTEHPGVVLPLKVRSPYGVLSFFTTAATFGTAADVTLAELTVEAFFPADPETDATVRRLAAERAAQLRARSGTVSQPSADSAKPGL
jgi:transcriptional regulator with XRE-family HTH domain